MKKLGNLQRGLKVLKTQPQLWVACWPAMTARHAAATSTTRTRQLHGCPPPIRLQPNLKHTYTQFSFWHHMKKIDAVRDSFREPPSDLESSPLGRSPSACAEESAEQQAALACSTMERSDDGPGRPARHMRASRCMPSARPVMVEHTHSMMASAPAALAWSRSMATAALRTATAVLLSHV